LGLAPLVDDLTDGDAAILPNEGRTGYWFPYNDATVGATQTPPSWNAATCTGGVTPISGQVCTSGSGFASWGAGIGIFLDAVGGQPPCSYDASVYSGVSFTLSGSVSMGYLRFNVMTAATSTPDNGGTCSASSGCEDHYGISFRPSAIPQTIRLYFSDLTQEPWGLAFSWNPTKIIGFHWEVKVDYYNYYGPASPVVFSNVCIDNVAFF
jgi:hypothetical protein